MIQIPSLLGQSELGDMDLLSSRSLRRSQAGFRHCAGFHARVVCCPDGGACPGVVVEGRVKEEEHVLVVHGK